MNPTIVRAIVSDLSGDVLFDSAEPRYGQRFSIELSELSQMRETETAAIRLHLDEFRSAEPPRARRLSSARPPIVRRYAPPAAPVADIGDSSKIVGYLLRAMIAALLVAGGLVSVAIAWGAAS